MKLEYPEPFQPKLKNQDTQKENMNHRTYGETQNCKGCRFWSEMIAKSEGSGVVAMCISSGSKEKGKYKFGSDDCNMYKSGHYGAVDSPGESEEIIKMYNEDA